MKKIPDLMIDLMKEDDLWHDLFNIIQNYTDDHVTKFIDALARIRDIDKETDSDIIDQSIRQLGIDIHQDILEANGDNIRSGFYQMSQFYQINGNYLYPKFIEFILGSGFRVQSLYTSDYVNFYPQPLGALITEGGDWFPTSHVDIYVYDGPTDKQFALNIGEGDIAYIKKANGYNELSTLDKFMFDEDLSEVIGRTLTDTDDVKFTRSLFRKRISDLFYKFAPIQEVIRNIYMARFAAADLFISGSAVIRGRKYIAAPPSIKSIELILPEKIKANEELGSLKGLVTWSSDVQSTVDMYDVSDSENLLTDPHTMMFRDPILGIKQNTDVVAKFLDFVETKTVSVYTSGVEITPDSIVLMVARSLASNTRSRVYIKGMFGDTSNTIEDSDNIKWFFDSPLIEIDGKYITVNEVLFETDIIISVVYKTSDGTNLTASESVHLSPILLETVAANLTQKIYINDNVGLTETNSIIQGNKYAVKTFALFTDGTESEVDATVESLTEFIELDSENNFTVAEAMSEYPFNLRSTLTSGERITATVEQYRAMAVVNVLQSISVYGEPSMVEASSQILRARGHWSDGNITFLSGIDWSSTFAEDADGSLFKIDISAEGVVRSPSVDSDTRFLIRASTQRQSDNAVVEGAFVLTVLETKRTLNSIDIYCADSIKEGKSAPLQFFGNWNNGTRTQIMPNVINIVERSSGNLVCAASIENDEVIYLNTTQLELRDSQYKFKDSETSVEHNSIELAHVAGSNSFSGVFDIFIEYDFENTVVEASRVFVATPILKQVLSISHNIPENLVENSRYFFSVNAVYDNGENLVVPAGWRVYNEDGESELDYVSVDIVSNKFLLEDIVDALVSYSREELFDMAATSVDFTEIEVKKLQRGEPFFNRLENTPSAAQTWPQKLSILFSTYDGITFPRSVFQTRNVEENEIFTLDCIVGATSIRTVHNITDRPDEPHNKILSWYIKGPVELFADEDITYSYSLVVDFDDLGPEYAVSNDWEIELFDDGVRSERREIIRYLVDHEGSTALLPMSTDGSNTRKTVDELDEEEMLDILPTRNVIAIDQNGYVYPKMNVAAHVIVKAIYNDGLSTFEETLDVYTKPVNKILLGLDMFLISPTENKTYDFGNLITDNINPWAEPYQNTLRYQLGVELRKVDEVDPVATKGVVVWRAEPVGRGISFDQASGRLYIAAQTEDSEVTLIANYSEEFREEETSEKTSREEVEARYVVRVSAHRALDSIDLTGPDFTLDSRDYYPVVRIKRRNGEVAGNVNVLSWDIVSADPRIERVGDFGFKIPKMTVDSQLVLRAIAKEGLNVISREFTINVLAGFIPLNLVMEYNPTGHKDNSTIQLKALLKLRNSPIPVDVTKDCFWLTGIDDEEISVGNRTGILELGYCQKDYVAPIRCIYQRDAFREETSIEINVQTSYPRYWTDKQLPISTNYFMEILNNKEDTILPSTIGGRILTLTDSDEYTYFACPVELGIPKFSLVPSKVKVNEWGNMGEPHNVVRTYINGDTQDWVIYRSSIRGFGHIELSVVYS